MNIVITGGAVALWETATARERVTYRGHSKEVTALGFAPDGRRRGRVAADAGGAGGAAAGGTAVGRVATASAPLAIP
ncbi:MAG TPA: hypothetical protein VFA26_25305 [Gemmataceae bacterium]|nr:hypothetical protein [Gemmataceae bacterium]